MFHRSVLFASLLLLSCAASPAPPPCRPTPDEVATARKQIEAEEALGDQLMKRGDMAEVAAHFAPDGAFLEADPEDPVLGPAGVQAALQSLAGKVKDFVATPREIEIYGDVAYYLGGEEFTLVGGSRLRGTSVCIFKRQPDGAWRTYRDIFQETNDDAKPADAAPVAPGDSAPAPCRATSNDVATVRRQIEQTEARNEDALRRGDAAAYAAAYAPDGPTSPCGESDRSGVARPSQACSSRAWTG